MRYHNTCLDRTKWRREHSQNFVMPGNAQNPYPTPKYPLLIADNWSAYAAGNWELNAAPTWTGLSGVGGSPSVTIVPTRGYVQAVQVGGSFYGMHRAPTAIVQTKARSADAFVTFQTAGSGSGGVFFLIGTDTTGDVGSHGNTLEITGATNGTWNAQLLIDGFQHGLATIQVNLNQRYNFMIEVDKNNIVNAYMNGVLILTTSVVSTSGTHLGLKIDAGGQGAGNGLVLGTVRLNGYAA